MLMSVVSEGMVTFAEHRTVWSEPTHSLQATMQLGSLLTLFLLLLLLTGGPHVQQVVTEASAPQPAATTHHRATRIAALKSADSSTELLLPLTDVVFQGRDLRLGLAQVN